jgi:hypothetical protein
VSIRSTIDKWLGFPDLSEVPEGMVAKVEPPRPWPPPPPRFKKFKIGEYRQLPDQIAKARYLMDCYQDGDISANDVRWMMGLDELKTEDFIFEPKR